MKCPRCRDVTLLLSERDRIEIDYCPECRGVWLDRGELDKLLERAEGDLDARMVAAASRRAERDGRSERDERYEKRDDDDERRYGNVAPKKKRKSFLSEMFEFGD